MSHQSRRAAFHRQQQAAAQQAQLAAAARVVPTPGSRYDLESGGRSSHDPRADAMNRLVNIQREALTLQWLDRPKPY